ncbi:Retrovirus-related Pol polyprotein from transposon TNT 1-94-like protein [Drosera capensis]
MREALAQPRWKAAMDEEISTLWENGTWDVVPTPPSQSCLNIKIVFLHGDLTKTVYMLQPPEYEIAGENHVCRLRKSLYGLKQSPRARFEKFRKFGVDWQALVTWLKKVLRGKTALAAGRRKIIFAMRFGESEVAGILSMNICPLRPLAQHH